MNCPHKKTWSYDLTSVDQRDFSRRLEDNLRQGGLEITTRFLTPTTLRGHRARSMLATSKTSTSTGTTGEKLMIDQETDREFPSGKRRRSSQRNSRKKFMAPKKFQNCEECGAIYFHVSRVFAVQISP